MNDLTPVASPNSLEPPRPPHNLVSILIISIFSCLFSIGCCYFALFSVSFRRGLTTSANNFVEMQSECLKPIPSKFFISSHNYIPCKTAEPRSHAHWSNAIIFNLESQYRSQGIANSLLEDDEYVSFSEQKFASHVSDLLNIPIARLNKRISQILSLNNDENVSQTIIVGSPENLFFYCNISHYKYNFNQTIMPEESEAGEPISTNPLEFNLFNVRRINGIESIKRTLISNSRPLLVSFKVPQRSFYIEADDGEFQCPKDSSNILNSIHSKKQNTSKDEIFLMSKFQNPMLLSTQKNKRNISNNQNTNFINKKHHQDRNQYLNKVDINEIDINDNERLNLMENEKNQEFEEIRILTENGNNNTSESESDKNESEGEAEIKTCHKFVYMPPTSIIYNDDSFGVKNSGNPVVMAIVGYNDNFLLKINSSYFMKGGFILRSDFLDNEHSREFFMNEITSIQEDQLCFDSSNPKNWISPDFKCLNDHLSAKECNATEMICVDYRLCNPFFEYAYTGIDNEFYQYNSTDGPLRVRIEGIPQKYLFNAIRPKNVPSRNGFCGYSFIPYEVVENMLYENLGTFSFDTIDLQVKWLHSSYVEGKISHKKYQALKDSTYLIPSITIPLPYDEVEL
ncbi:hypothetical protein TRFO_11615 [Tritrichomonas foetus]|uniref:Uncharacterized protein n=1 Tax=Tritrichomonas foetus TaxID=1144522 RepID=A0A1J4J2G5_9EUKA|nr:hypothetical protein TRFO_11615 [Tritrichomonas foetus]|eukprot:OHS93630.1 hypothetical protein TRFO_11615 [Tritrichomonas foetus]